MEFIKDNQQFTEIWPRLGSHANGHTHRKSPQIMIIKWPNEGIFFTARSKPLLSQKLNPALPVGLKSLKLLNSASLLLYISQDAHFPTEVSLRWMGLVEFEPDAGVLTAKAARGVILWVPPWEPLSKPWA